MQPENGKECSKKMNYFIEGLQGSGKSTLTTNMMRKYLKLTDVREGDYSPVELAWCSYVNNDKYNEILDKYSEIRTSIKEKSHIENNHVIICYTQIITNIEGFHKELEQYEIYNGRIQFEEFEEIVLNRFEKWSGKDTIFECSLFQNIVEDLILFRDISDDEIILFYEEIEKVLRDKEYRIIYLETENVSENIDIIRKERSDEHGNEMWFPLMLGYFNESPYAKNRGVSGEAELLKHFLHRQELELKICREVFKDRYTVLKSKNYTL